MSDNVLIKDPNAKFGYRMTRVDAKKREENLEPFNRIAHDYLMENVFTPENAKSASGLADKMLAEPAPFAKGEKVRLNGPLSQEQKDWDDDYEILGFYNNGELIDENKASPYNKSYGLRVKNLKTGQEYPTHAGFLKRIEQEPEDDGFGYLDPRSGEIVSKKHFEKYVKPNLTPEQLAELEK